MYKPIKLDEEFARHQWKEHHAFGSLILCDKCREFKIRIEKDHKMLAEGAK